VSVRLVRSHVQQLRRDLQAARLGRDLLDDKREAILRALLDRMPRREAAGAAAANAAHTAQRTLCRARLENGAGTVEAAALAQPAVAAVDWLPGSVVGVPTPSLRGHVPPFAPRYGAAPVTANLDRAGEDYSALISAFIAFAEEDEAVRNLQSGLSRTIRRLRALEHVVIPGIERDLHAVAVALEEDERDDTVRQRQARTSRRTPWPLEPNATP
jgi:V/A-type H+-transporting ATPase subunit D